MDGERPRSGKRGSTQEWVSCVCYDDVVRRGFSTCTVLD